MRSSLIAAFLCLASTASADPRLAVTGPVPEGWRVAALTVAEAASDPAAGLGLEKKGAVLQGRLLLGEYARAVNLEFNRYVERLEKRGARIVFEDVQGYDPRKTALSYTVSGDGPARAGRVRLRPVAPFAKNTYLLFGEWPITEDAECRRAFDAVFAGLRTAIK